ncbi:MULTISPECIES: carbohydrate ABC transporter permease [Enterobacteriaceae]|uniref:carbohydrate ABC transporter permease n=1 Tax=Enterobacteriaceae TaxID=543 RepID=UPI0015DC4891|nr:MULTISPECIES: sugar ABC transporter permease [unclassified Klebsiella]HAT3952606.1 sugar ABC transporter permease [Kluyvera ascorbata]BBS90093.1 sugar ABC transporter permease [Klebsiella sp. WP7-S18-CRE-02]BBS95115.1 sugar ABC transporter permease [Klebsiella sp. WP7-S18-CRE-03]BBT00147.1 sugar ABC transporter permease [Klebsiella sp. WP7-S18-ESBL-04]BBT69364.1 sugar ABC transporter permease [Klebsiella sp. WP8-S18-ESBL-06]
MAGYDSRTGGLLASTWIGYSLLFWFYPLAWLAVLSVTQWQFIGTPRFSGLQNLLGVVNDALFWTSMWNICRFLMWYIPIVFIASLLFAAGLRRIKYGKSFIALSFLLANISSGVAYSIVFSKLFSEYGPVNQFLRESIGVSVPWFTNPDCAMLSIALIVTWKFVGYYGLILYSGMQAIPNDIYSAAMLDKTGRFKQGWAITLPMMNPQIVMVMVLAITVAFSIFTEPYLITGGGPLNSTTSPMVVMYEAAFQNMKPTWAATMSIIVAGCSFLAIWVFRKLFEKNIEIV